jgi:hypothetical protein
MNAGSKAKEATRQQHRRSESNKNKKRCVSAYMGGLGGEGSVLLPQGNDEFAHIGITAVCSCRDSLLKLTAHA